MLRVAVADDQELVRAGFVALLAAAPDIEVVGEAGQGEEAVRLVRATHPDVVLMDVRMPVLNGIEATLRITADPDCAGSRIVMLTTFGLDEYVFGALRAGATGFLLKDTPPVELLRAVRIAADGDALLSPSITRRLVEVFASTRAAQPPQARGAGPDRSRDRRAHPRRPRTVQCRHLPALHIGQATVKTYIGRLLAKLDATARVHLVIHAYESGLVFPGTSARGPVDAKS